MFGVHVNIQFTLVKVNRYTTGHYRAHYSGSISITSFSTVIRLGDGYQEAALSVLVEALALDA
ncbi:hypothetical protein quinque_000148, partial [Culex quinquefasciatus]